MVVMVLVVVVVVVVVVILVPIFLFFLFDKDNNSTKNGHRQTFLITSFHNDPNKSNTLAQLVAKLPIPRWILKLQPYINTKEKITFQAVYYLTKTIYI